MGWLIALGILVLLAILPLGVSALYDADGPVVRVIAGPVRLTVFPLKKKKDEAGKKKPEKKKQKKAKAPEAARPDEKQAAKQQAKPEAAQQPKQQGGSITDFLPLVSMAFDFLVDFRRKLRVNRLELNLVMAGGDPCDLAINYGKAWAALGNLWPKLEEWFVIQKRDVKIQCDFEASQTLVTARLDLTITLGRLIGTAVWHGVRILIQFLKIMNKRKGGAAT